jgi:hypothetical protein
MNRLLIKRIAFKYFVRKWNNIPAYTTFKLLQNSALHTEIRKISLTNKVK